MTNTSRGPDSDEAMLTYLAGDDHVLAEARKVWAATGTVSSATRRLLTAQLQLQNATSAYSAAVRSCGIPAEHAERIGAALIFRLGRVWLVDGPSGDERPAGQ